MPKKVKKSINRQYRCQICNRQIDVKAALMHIKAEEYLINLIKEDHPTWQNDSKACDKCIAYYRKLVNEAEI